MCGRFASFLPPEAVRVLFRTTDPLVNHAASWNVAPTQPALVIRRHPETGERHLDQVQWGLIPHFTKDLKAVPQADQRPCGNRRHSGMFRAALASRRCLVPADAFYEWRVIGRRDGAPLAFAGLWEGWRSPDGNTVRSFAILTTSANATMAVLHDRIPVILEEDQWPIWLGEVESNAPDLMQPAAEDVLRLWPVSRAVTSVRNNGAELLDRIDDPHAPPPSNAPPGENPA
ncbi:MAG TPA: SOS response-associated peptidase [Acetobacteraceae bacterium]